MTGPAHAAVSSALLLAALSLSFAGCSLLQPDNTPKANPSPQVETRSAPEPDSTTQQPEVFPKPAQPAPQHSTQLVAAKTLPGTPSKGAQKLVSWPAPAPARVSESTTPSAEPSTPKAPIAAASVAKRAPQAEALVFKGPPRHAPPRRTGLTVLLWLGLLFGAAAAAVLMRLRITRRAKASHLPAAKKEELEMPSELLFKEPATLPQEAVMAEKIVTS